MVQGLVFLYYSATQRRCAKFFRYAFIFLLPQLLNSTIALSSESGIVINGGLASIDEGDDRPRPAFATQIVWGGSGMFSQLFLWGREVATVKEQTTLLTTGYQQSGVFGQKWLQAGVGGAALLESTQVYDPATRDTDRDNAFNFGGLLSLHAVCEYEQFSLQGGWDAMLFPAGQASILLVTARKQALSLTAGVRF